MDKELMVAKELARGAGAILMKHYRGKARVDWKGPGDPVTVADREASRFIVSNLAREFPEDTSVQFMYLPTLRALFSLSTHDASAAIDALQTASRYDLALGSIGFTGRFGGLYPIYVRGLAYLAAGHPAEAAGEFQRILDHRSIVLVDPMDAMARLQLARALTLASDVPRAKRAYDDFLTQGRNADADIPLFGEARVEYTRLR